MKRVSIQRDIYVYLFGLLIVLTSVYLLMINQSYEVGLKESAKYGFLYEVKVAEQQYLSSGTLPSSNSKSLQVFTDLEKLPSVYLKLFDWSSLETGVIYEQYVPGKQGEYGHYYYSTYQYVAEKQSYLYVVSEYDESIYYQLYEQSPPESVDQVHSAFWLIGALLLLVFVLIRFLIHRLTKPILQLSDWSRELDLDQADKLQHFRYAEIQQLADQLVKSVDSQRQAIEREEFFLRAASHELRTPVATISASSEMLARLSNSMSKSGQRAVARIDRSIVTMQNLITSLLWMSRNQQLDVDMGEVDMKATVGEALSIHRYLADDKKLQINIEAEETCISAPLPVVLVEVVINNLVRNAFQHASEGDVNIGVFPDRIIVSNAVEKSDQESTANSFGVGLMLIKRLCQHKQWNLNHYTAEQRHHACVEFTPPPSSK